MLDAIRTAWLAFWAIPHIHWILAAGWVLYLFGLGLWIVLRHKIGHGTVQAAQPALL